MVSTGRLVSRITAGKRLKAETPLSGSSSADRSLAGHSSVWTWSGSTLSTAAADWRVFHNRAEPELTPVSPQEA